MILRELFYYDKETIEPIEDNRYEPQYDQSIVDIDDTRKTRLSLRQINRARKASELHTEEKTKELDFVRQMYGLAAQTEAAGV
jgi:predicted RNA-binding protein with RPS1 domain